MIPFKNEQAILEWLTLAENHFIQLKALVKCEKNAHKMVLKTTKDLAYRVKIKDRVNRVNECLKMVVKYICKDD